MRVYALISSKAPTRTLDLYLLRETAEAELHEILLDAPGWVDVLRIEALELDQRQSSAN